MVTRSELAVRYGLFRCLAAVTLCVVGLFLITGCVHRDLPDLTGADTTPVNDANTPGKKAGGTVVAYYFHGEFRCAACLKIEDLIKKALTQTFADELERGELELRVIDRDEAGNRHYVELFQLETQALIVAIYRDGALEQWRNLAGIWDHYQDETSFFDYIRDEIVVSLSALHE